MGSVRHDLSQRNNSPGFNEYELTWRELCGFAVFRLISYAAPEYQETRMYSH